ncbi:type II secretion system F family protein [Streptomyces sp. NBC_00237]|uniref:type II secretion system F family protein n=1 Tax=Streptomyces sp. NBC_00237 TaxID=2975687 RepID=UPI00224D70CE|nr:type II secretion system F family protein [Streptomyces sp. NBC_00237]MCX5206893.1 type II secretion system F family protein [Streptomyces sp. NBC_00237]
MTPHVLIGLLLGAGLALSLALVVLGARPPAGSGEGARRWRVPLRASGRQWAVAAGAAVVAGAATGWPIAGVLTVVGVLTLPDLLVGDRRAAARTEKLEAVALWAEMLRDTLSAAAGLEQAILATAPVAPEAVQEEAVRLAARIEGGQPLGEALRAFAEEVDDATCDMVAAALVMAAERQARQLAPLLGQLAAATREQVTMRLRTEAGRSRVRTSVRVITGTTLTMAGGLAVLNRAYLDPYSSVTGQIVLAGVGGLFAVAFWWLKKIATLEEDPRILKGVQTSAGAEVVVR